MNKKIRAHLVSKVGSYLSKVGNLYDYSFKVGNKCRLIIDKQEVVHL